MLYRMSIQIDLKTNFWVKTFTKIPIVHVFLQVLNIQEGGYSEVLFTIRFDNVETL